MRGVLDATLSGTLTLSNTLSVFVHQWTYNQAIERRNYADPLADAVLGVRRSMWRNYLPMILR